MNAYRRLAENTDNSHDDALNNDDNGDDNGDDDDSCLMINV
jgi:hypothetical protein